MPPVFSVQDGRLSFGPQILFDNLKFFINKNDKICLIGANGSGKSSLLKCLLGIYELDRGEVYKAPNLTFGYLEQSFEKVHNKTIYNFVLEAFLTDPRYKELSFDAIKDQFKYKADIVLENLNLDGNLNLQELSGGMLRRAYLARVLVLSPDVLMLDEPTNHLDVKNIEWLEDYILSYKGSVISISHDRKFLTNTTNNLWWLDRGTLRATNKGFKYFDEWQEQILEDELRSLEKIGKKIDQEQHWLNYGVTARRKRNQGRLSKLHALREKYKNYHAHLKKSDNKMDISISQSELKSYELLSCQNLSFGYEASKKLINNFSTLILKQERIGIIGANGTGKSTLVKLFLKLLEPSAGTVNHSTNLLISYFDQNREVLKEEETLWDTIVPNGGHYVTLPNGREMHVGAYLKNFLFDSKLLKAKVSTLSGGQKARLLLAKVLSEKSNLLVLDEPTNDLDMDSIEVLSDIIYDYPGTVILICHDRDFLDKIATRTLVFEENNPNIVEVSGGFEDYLKYYKKESLTKETKKASKINIEPVRQNTTPAKNKLSFKFQRLLEILPIEIETLYNKIIEIENTLSININLYQEDFNKFQELSKTLEKLKEEKSKKEDELLDIMLMQEE